MSIDQLYQLQHGLAVQTGDGIRLKLDKSKNTKNKNKSKMKKQRYKQLSNDNIQGNINDIYINNNSNDKNRNRVLSLIKTYKTKGGLVSNIAHKPYTNVISKSVDRSSQDEDDDDDELSSNESMYNYDNQHKDDVETDDGGYTTPTCGSNKEFELNEKEISKDNMMPLHEEGIVIINKNNDNDNMIDKHRK